MNAVVVNFSSTTLAAALAPSAVTAALNAPYFPALPVDGFYVAVVQAFSDRSKVEVVHVTAVTGGNITLLRGQENTTPIAFAAGDLCSVRLTAGLMAPVLAHIKDTILHAPPSTVAGRQLLSGGPDAAPEWGRPSAPASESVVYNPDGSVASYTAVIDGLTSSSEYTYSNGDLVQERTTFDGVISTTTHSYSNGDWTGAVTTTEDVV